MTSNSLAVLTKKTTQKALLEPLLARMRSRLARRVLKGANVLDFGCGADFWNLRAIADIATERIGFDVIFEGQNPHRTDDGILVIGSLDDAREYRINRVTALACFEHIDPEALPAILRQLASLTTPDAVIFGTVPTPAAKPILEFLSYKLGIIDRSQIEDHKIYYNRATIASTVAKGGWNLASYGRFQFGFNSWFILSRSLL